MNKLSKPKQQQLILTLLVSVGVVAGLYYFLIRAQQDHLTRLAELKTTTAQKLQTMKKAIGASDNLEQELCDAQKRLAKNEEGMASGDLYSWTITTLRTFKVGYKVEIPQFSNIDGPKDVTLLPQFPYKQASLTVAGTAQYQDFGRFLAEFENQFPFIRVLNLTLEPASAAAAVGNGSDHEKLAFRMEIAALVKPSGA